MGQEYSNLKMAWHYVRDGGLPAAPKQAQVILSDMCNQNCHFCAYRMDGYTSNELFVADSTPAKYGHNNPKRWMPTDRALALLEELAGAGVLAVQFTGGGEPTVHPEHERIFKRTLELGLKAALVSNGLHWSDHLLGMLPRFSWVRVSVDAGTPATYATIRDTPPGNFEKVWNHVARLANDIRQQLGCLLGIGYVVTPENWKEIGDGVARAADSGAAYIRLSAMFNPDGAAPYVETYEQIQHAIGEARAAHEREDFAVHDLFGDRLQDLAEGPPDYPTCYYQAYTTYVGGDLNLYRCCVLAYNKRGLLGSLKGQTFEQAWKAAQEDFKTFDAGSCDRCQFNARNRAMNYIAGGDPVHKEFP
jgi:MoaA/NifB/PqqE/SkfB family radical SAM enzyme